MSSRTIPDALDYIARQVIYKHVDSCNDKEKIFILSGLRCAWLDGYLEGLRDGRARESRGEGQAEIERML